MVGIAGSSNSKKIENNQFYFDAYILIPDEKGTHYISHNGIYLHILNEKCTTLSHKSCIMKFGKKSILQEEKKGDRDGTIQLYKIFVF
ncbi:MAG: hypothetical protein PWP28_2379 [Oceanotoga sp.]|uniref:hypothetical protein n=1 Tax=Oceanotoga sp. TaxID=2108366 RepID=UPI00264FDD04|nr:hypothetical protein [Oceanotoga sp.]MDN5343499.1 hypothetical protein [Oceanotoga sp.]